MVSSNDQITYESRKHDMTTLIRILKFFETEQIINVSVEWDPIQKPTLFGIASINELI